MNSKFPTKLRSADISRFAVRATQLEKAKPVITYWCTHSVHASGIGSLTTTSIGEYWILNQIISKGLANSDDECMQYSMALMDKLEKVRCQRSARLIEAHCFRE